jgi:predicted nucleotidyltransferase component of viral defense system
MLAGIYAHEELAGSWIFKGGTCLKKCFFETYRFSEDLDFTLRNVAHLDEVFLKLQIPVHRGQSFQSIADSVPVIADSF